MSEIKFYDPTLDEQFQKPYIDKEEWREQEGYTYVHGGFEGTSLRFAFFFPKKEDYEGRFFQFLPPVQGDENAAIGRKGMEDRIAFALKHGGYYVESNMGAVPFAPIPDPTILYKASAAAAEYSRKVAQRLFGGRRPYGYVYGGSGGSYKTISCIENTAVWDGAAPYVSGTPYSIPYMVTIRSYAKRTLRRVLPLIADYVEPGGISEEELYAKMTDEEREAFEEVRRFGFPLYDFFMYEFMDDGSLPIFIKQVEAYDPAYFELFWKEKGFLGADPSHSAVRDRIKMDATVLEVHVPDAAKKEEKSLTGVDDAFLRSRIRLDGKAWIRVDKAFPKDAYLHGMHVIIKSGASEGYQVTLAEVDGDIAVIEPFFGATDFFEKFSALRAGDVVSFDNSVAIALQCYQRHQVPKEGYPAFNVYRNADGTPKYPQREKQFGPKLAYGGSGNVQKGYFGNTKVILTAALMDESAFPWMQVWYHNKVRENYPDETTNFRIWYVNHALHGDMEHSIEPKHLVVYLGVLYSALLACVDWVEKGIAPCASTAYSVDEAVVRTPCRASERNGIQPTLHLTANGQTCAHVKVGEEVVFSAEAELPAGAGAFRSMEWNFEGEDGFIKETLSASERTARVVAKHVYKRSGTYFAVARVTSNLHGDDMFTPVYELDRVRIIVE